MECLAPSSSLLFFHTSQTDLRVPAGASSSLARPRRRVHRSSREVHHIPHNPCPGHLRARTCPRTSFGFPHCRVHMMPNHRQFLLHLVKSSTPPRRLPQSLQDTSPDPRHHPLTLHVLRLIILHPSHCIPPPPCMKSSETHNRTILDSRPSPPKNRTRRLRRPPRRPLTTPPRSREPTQAPLRDFTMVLHPTPESPPSPSRRSLMRTPPNRTVPVIESLSAPPPPPTLYKFPHSVSAPLSVSLIPLPHPFHPRSTASSPIVFSGWPFSTSCIPPNTLRIPS